MDSKAFFKLSYGVYIISTSADNKEGGCVINTLTRSHLLPPGYPLLSTRKTIR